MVAVAVLNHVVYGLKKYQPTCQAQEHPDSECLNMFELFKSIQKLYSILWYQYVSIMNHRNDIPKLLLNPACVSLCCLCDTARHDSCACMVDLPTFPKLMLKKKNKRYIIADHS